jgi:hypothetical protein
MSSYPEKPYLRLANGMYVSAGPSGDMSFFTEKGSEALRLISDQNAGSTDTPGRATRFAGLTLAGSGLCAIVADTRSNAQTGAVASVATYTVGTSDHTFIVSANVLVTVATTHSFTVTCAYTDEGNTARTLTMAFLLVAGSAITNTIANAAGAVPYMGIPVQIRAKASTAITIATTGTFTTVTYNVEGLIVQVA